jgi:hypothetical protein
MLMLGIEEALQVHKLSNIFIARISMGKSTLKPHQRNKQLNQLIIIKNH